MAIDINDQLQRMTGALALSIDKRETPSSPWMGAVKKSAWPDEIGTQFETVKSERAIAQGTHTWQDVGTPTGTGSAPCNPDSVEIKFQQSRQAVTLQTTAFNSEDLCVQNMRSAWQMEQQINLAKESMGEIIRDAWIDRNRDSYIQYCDNKYVLAPGLPKTTKADGDNFDTTGPATSKLTNGALDSFYVSMGREGAGRDAEAYSNGQPVYKLFVSAETSRSLKKSDDAVREDFRYANPDSLLGAIGQSHTYNGFLHVIDDTPRRFNYDSGQPSGQEWVRVLPFVVDGTTGLKELNPLYATATHEDSVIFVKSAIECLVPPSIANIGACSFTPQNYIGELKWKNIAHRTDNPDGDIGFFRAVLASAIRPRQTQFGVAVRHLVCPLVEFVGCS